MSMSAAFLLLARSHWIQFERKELLDVELLTRSQYSDSCDLLQSILQVLSEDVDRLHAVHVDIGTLHVWSCLKNWILGKVCVYIVHTCWFTNILCLFSISQIEVSPPRQAAEETVERRFCDDILKF